jgi:hypothetical protein
MTEPLPSRHRTHDGEELDPQDALAVDATPDETRTHADGDETDSVLRSDGATVPVDADD